MRVILCTALLASASGAVGQPAPRTYANPIDIDYRYNFEQEDDGISYRTGADPAIVRYRDGFYLFQTLADGYWRSTNLVDWTFITPSLWRMRGIVAPAAWVDGDRLFLLPSMTWPESLLVSTDPASGRLDFFDRMMPPLPGAALQNVEPKPGELPPGPWDPALFKDDDGRWYMYWNSSNTYPLYGIEIGMDGALSYKGEATTLFGLDPTRHGWERFGQDHSGTLADGTPIAPFIEGAWMTKVRGRYYFQYGAPGTEYNAYATGTYVGDSPLGPFTYAAWNPVAYKPGGFVQGAGHGSTVEDFHGNWWTSGTPWIGHNWAFERRIGLWPTRFEADGQMWTSTRFGDFPHVMPDGPVEDIEGLFTGWMLLSYGKPATGSSTRSDFVAARATDEDPRTFWVADSKQAGETLTIDLGGPRTVRAVQVNFADHEMARFADAPDLYTEFVIQASTDGARWREVARTLPPRRDRPNAYLQLAEPESARFIRYVHGHIGGANLAISDLRVFGTDDAGRNPTRPVGVTATRDRADPRNATIRWRTVPGAVGYNVRWGLRPDRLALAYQRWAAPGKNDETLELRALNGDAPYWVAIEAFNETGVSPLSLTVRVR